MARLRRGPPATGAANHSGGSGSEGDGRQAIPPAFEAARRKRQQAQEALEAAQTDLDNALEDTRDLELGGNDDALPPRTDYTLKEIVEKLSHYHQRAT